MGITAVPFSDIKVNVTLVYCLLYIFGAHSSATVIAFVTWYCLSNFYQTWRITNCTEKRKPFITNAIH